MSDGRGRINHALLESLERQLAQSKEEPAGGNPLAELARLIDGDPLADLDSGVARQANPAPPASPVSAQPEPQPQAEQQPAMPPVAARPAMPEPPAAPQPPVAPEMTPPFHPEQPTVQPVMQPQPPADAGAAAFDAGWTEATPPAEPVVAPPSSEATVPPPAEPQAGWSADWPTGPEFTESGDRPLPAWGDAMPADERGLPVGGMPVDPRADLSESGYLDPEQLARDIEADFARELAPDPAAPVYPPATEPPLGAPSHDPAAGFPQGPATPETVIAPQPVWNDAAPDPDWAQQQGWPQEPSAQPAESAGVGGSDRWAEPQWEEPASVPSAPKRTVWDDPVFDSAETDPRFEEADLSAIAPGDGAAHHVAAAGPPMDDAPARGGFRGALILASVLGIVVLGAAGAFAYRAVVGSGDGAPPTIAAADGEVKVTPDGEAVVEEDGGKLVYDRIGGDDGTAQLVDRSEEAAAESDGRIIRVIEPADPPEGAETDAPRRVRTVVVRPDGTVVEDSVEAPVETVQVPDPPAFTQTPVEPVSTEIVSTEAAPAGTVSTEALSTETVSPDAAQAGTTAAETTPSQNGEIAVRDIPAISQEQAAAQAQAQANQAAGQATNSVAAAPTGPLNLQPVAPQPVQQQAAPQPVPQRAAQQQVAAAQSAQQPVATQPAATLPAGSFLVQVAAARQEQQAQTTAQSISQRFGGIVGGYGTRIQRADLGDRGIFYRVNVGPIGSRNEANQVCDRLKSAGVDCFVRQI